jgi:hypothetical protein
MKIAYIVAACSLLASTALATAANAVPVHHKQCKMVMQHHHKVRHCW